MKRAQRTGERSSAVWWLVLAAVLVAALGAAIDLTAPARGPGWLAQPGAASALGFAAALAAGLAARLMRLVLGRREGGRDAGDRA